MTCAHLEGANPRQVGWCVKCGRKMPSKAKGRDARYERQYLDEVEREAARRHGVNATGIGERVLGRLTLGAARYGDADYEGKDMVAELLEETPDVIAYCLLESEKRLASRVEPDDAGLHHLFCAAVLAAAADWHARAAR